MSDATPKTVLEVLTAGSDYLAARQVDQPRLACEFLISRLLNCRRLELALMHDKVLDEKRLAALRRGVKRVGDGEPLQYVLGQTEFMGHVIKTDPRALIPRQDTEVLVAEVIKCKALWERPAARGETRGGPAIVDVGTGSGCIAISLALAHPEGKYLALDVSEEALGLARENAAALGVAARIAFERAELADAVEPEHTDAIVANLPYIPTAVYEKLPTHILKHEPRSALDGGPDGLAVIEQLVQDAAIALRAGGFLFLEIGHDQAPRVTEFLQDAGFEDVTVKQDLGRRDRVVSGRIPTDL
jgi:release factor glutamine methyltransferase